MDGLSIATAFSSIVGLLGLYKSQADTRDSQDLDRYIDWLRRHEHRDLADLIGHNAELATSLRLLIQQQHQEVVAKLTTVDQLLSRVASRVDGVQPLAIAVHPNAVLSDQAVSVLCQMNEANASRFLVIGDRGGKRCVLIDGNGGQLHFDDARFIEDDLGTLNDCGLLRLDFNKEGRAIYIVTRAGAEVGK